MLAPPRTRRANEPHRRFTSIDNRNVIEGSGHHGLTSG